MKFHLLVKTWLPLLVLVSTAAAVYFAASPGISASADPALSKPLALLARINTFVWGLLVGVVADWLLFTLPAEPSDPPEPYTVHWYERQRLRVSMMALGVVVFVFAPGAGSLAT